MSVPYQPPLLVSPAQGRREGSALSTGLRWRSMPQRRAGATGRTVPVCHLQKTPWSFSLLPHLYPPAQKQTLQPRIHIQCRCWHPLPYRFPPLSGVHELPAARGAGSGLPQPCSFSPRLSPPASPRAAHLPASTVALCPAEDAEAGLLFFLQNEGLCLAQL